MKQWLVVILILSAVLMNPGSANSNTAPNMPCSVVLEPVNAGYPNAKGVALVYKVKLIPSFPRTSISIHAIHLPAPSSLGDYDRYEGFASIHHEISWRFVLYPTPEAGGPTWSGRIDDITANLANSIVDVRLSNSKTGKLGPVVLTNRMTNCK